MAAGGRALLRRGRRGAELRDAAKNAVSVVNSRRTGELTHGGTCCSTRTMGRRASPASGKALQGCPTPRPGLISLPSCPRLQNGEAVITCICPRHLSVCRTKQMSAERGPVPASSLLGTGCPVAGRSPTDSPGQQSAGQVRRGVGSYSLGAFRNSLVVTGLRKTPILPHPLGQCLQPPLGRRPLETMQEGARWLPV